MNESQKYRLLMLAFEHLADGKDLTYRIANDDGKMVGSTSSIVEILQDAPVGDRKTFDPDDVAVVNKAFKKQEKHYPGDVIRDCVRVMVGLMP